MSVAIGPYQNRPMQISLVLNVALAFGIFAMLPIPQAEGAGAGARLCADNPGNVTVFEVAQVGKVRDRASVDVKRPARVIRKAALVTSSKTTPIAVPIRCRRN